MISNKRIAIGILAIAVILGASMVYAVFVNHNTPSVTPPAIPFLSSTCSNLVEEGALQPVTGIALLDCGPSIPAFTVTNQNQAQFTATFTLPSVAQGTVGPLEVSQTVNQCAQGTGFLLSSGQPVPLPSGQYDYCLGYGGFPSTGGQTIPSFSIAWS